MTLTRGTRLGRYEILAPLGKGGMGEVYRARDSQLGRDVAVKILSPHLAEDSTALKRFEKETRAVASLSHPNILEIHDSGVQDGIAYAVTELLEGETLREKLNHSTMPAREVVKITAALADGLSAAHTKGVIHRDLKPENVFLLKDGRVKILDFGLARIIPTVSEQEITGALTKSKITEMGVVMGTIPYMSPEQIRGEPPDARSDIFSLGCILYEMLAHKRAFGGGTAIETTAAILKEDPPRLEGTSLELQRIVERCLQKNPDRRFHSAHDLSYALQDIASSGAAPSAPSSAGLPLKKRIIWIAAAVFGVAILIVAWRFWVSHQKSPLAASRKIESLAVLPLINMSGDPKQEYFADGMTEELITKLSQISSLRVISRTSVMEYKHAKESLPEIARGLKVDAIVEGSVLKAENRIRITAQLIQADTDRHLWGNSYERDLQDVLTLQNEVATAIADEIQIKLAPEEAARFRNAPKVNSEAYQAYLRGIDIADREINEKNLRSAVDDFQQAVDLDPGFASAHAQLSKAQSFLYFAFDRKEELLKESKRAIDRAFAIQPDLPEGHLALGFYYYRGFRDYDSALHEWETAKKALPNNKWILEGEIAVYQRRGKFKKALELEEKLLLMNPRNAQDAFNVGNTQTYLRNFVEAQHYFVQAAALEPDFKLAVATNLISWKGNTREARLMIQETSSVNPVVIWGKGLVELSDRKYQTALETFSSLHADRDERNVFRGIVYSYLKDQKSAHSEFEEAREDLEGKVREKPDDFELRGLLGMAYAGLGRKEDAIREGKLGVEVLPISKDAIWGPDALESLARIYTMVGEENKAIDQLQYLLSIPSQLNVWRLRVEPWWDPLRNNPRFRKLVESGPVS